MRPTLSILICFVISLSGFAQKKVAESIRLNQVGFYPEGQKVAVVLDETVKSFTISSPDLKTNYFSGTLSEVRSSSFSPTKTRIADFSSFKKPGVYVVVVPGFVSSSFEIKTNIHHDVAKASIRFFYFQRFSISLKEEFAGIWKRPSSSSHKSVVIHASATSPGRLEGTVISSPRGWIDAGDYNKYIVNSGITTSTLLSAYEDFPAYYDTLSLLIPENKNALPDLLDEILWNVRWMLTMQDPADGGVYHKCTNAKFDGMVMPDQANTPRYVVQKGTAAALNFAAVMAQSARVFKRFESTLPGLGDSCLSASVKAWAWSKQNPNVEYDQRKMNAQFDPNVSTGGYGDTNFSDEFLWAGAEFYNTTGNAVYLNRDELVSGKLLIPSWDQVKGLAYYSLIRMKSFALKEDEMTVQKLKDRIIQKADSMISSSRKHYYATVMGESSKDFIWGSNSVAANQSILLIYAFHISNDKKYLDAALANLDYILGRNATGYSYVTAFGDKTPMHPHHRPSEADGVIEPVPGMLAGGPNPGMQDKCSYPSSVPDEAYVDDVRSYASNEVAINWNAPLVYLLGAMEVLMK